MVRTKVFAVSTRVDARRRYLAIYLSVDISVQVLLVLITFGEINKSYKYSLSNKEQFTFSAIKNNRYK